MYVSLWICFFLPLNVRHKYIIMKVRPRNDLCLMLLKLFLYVCEHIPWKIYVWKKCKKTKTSNKVIFSNSSFCIENYWKQNCWWNDEWCGLIFGCFATVSLMKILLVKQEIRISQERGVEKVLHSPCYLKKKTSY